MIRPDFVFLLVASAVGVPGPLGEAVAATVSELREPALPPSAVARLGRREPLRHTSFVSGLAFSPDSRTLVTAGYDGRAAAWEVATGRELFSFPTQGGRSTAIAFSPSGKVLVHGIATGAELRDPSSGALVSTLRLVPNIRNLAFVGERLAWSSDSWRIGVSDLGAGGFSVLLGPEMKTHHCLAGSPSGDLVAYCQEGAVHLLDAHGAGRRRSFPLAGQVVAFSPRGTRLAIGTAKSLVVADLPDGPLHEIPLPEEASSLAFAPDEKVLAIGDAGGRVQLHDAADGHVVRTFASSAGRAHPSITHLAYAPGGAVLAAVENGSASVTLLDPATGRLLLDDGGHRDTVVQLAFSRGGKRLVSAGWDGRVVLWTLDGTPRRIDMQSASAASLLETARAAAPDHLSAETTALSQSDEEVVRCPSGPAAAKWLGEDTVALLGPSGRRVRTLSTVTRFQPAQLRWSAGCEYLVSLDGHAGRVQVIRVRDGQRRVWKFYEWTKLVAAFSPTEQVMLVAVSPLEPPIDGNLDGPSAGKIYYAADIHRIDLAAGRKSNPYKVEGDLWKLAYAPDGKSVALAVDQRVELRRPSDGALRQTLTGHSDQVTTLAFAPDGRVLASGSKDTTIFLWQLAP